MEKCLICQKEKNKGEKKCKVCAMMFDNGVKYKSFDFCCKKCVYFFKNIESKAQNNIIFSNKESLI